MIRKFRFEFLVAALVAVAVAATGEAEETHLFNGKNLDGWTFHHADEDSEKVAEPWVVARGMLVCRGLASGYLMHEKESESYVLTLEVRTMSTEEGNGKAIGSLGRIYINAAEEEGAFREPKSVEISLREMGDVYFRDIDRKTLHDTDAWVFRAPDDSDDVERDMGEWNQLKVISNGKRLTVIINGATVNQVDPVNRPKGAVALRSDRGFFPAPTFYRNIVVRPIANPDLEEEKKATVAFSKVRAAVARKKAAEEAQRAEEERMQAEAEQKLAKEWADVQVAEDVELSADVRWLPYPANAREIEFEAVFDSLEFESASSLKALSKFYSTEMAKRGWRVTETDIEEDEVTVTFRHGGAEVELNLDESSDYVDVSIDCEGLSFDGTDDPAGLIKMGVPQPEAYLVLQRELKAPKDHRDHEYDMGERRLFKSTLKLPVFYKYLTQQLLQKGYRESRRPIISDDRRYSEFVKGGVEISVNAFTHEIGSRVVLTFEMD
ncbi:DUF1080 domain-containing protein [Pirellulales bacterium]|nr:DUF1080 domain-containing protein [Pirellulales bacterium]